MKSKIIATAMTIGAVIAMGGILADSFTAFKDGIWIIVISGVIGVLNIIWEK